MSIEIPNLDAVDRQLADLLWVQEDPHGWIRTLTPELQRRAETVRQLMIAAALDQYVGDHDLQPARDLLDRVRG